MTPDQLFSDGELREAARAGWHAARGEDMLVGVCRDAVRRLQAPLPCPEEFIVAIDTREQRPYSFAFFPTETKTLKTGDYSIVGLEDRVAIERKSKIDAYGSFGRGRKRFERELQRLARLDYAALVIESSLIDFLTRPEFSRMNPKSAMASAIAWSVKYRVHVFFAGDRCHGAALTRHLLQKYWKYYAEQR